MTGSGRSAIRKEGLYGAVPLAHFHLSSAVREGSVVIDATCGNGNDTVFLARTVGAAGKVWAFDLQEKALLETERRLVEEGLRERVELVHAGHERLSEVVPGKVAAVIFNLGYLPGAGRETATSAAATLQALDQATELLLPRGLITVCLYTGHAGGAEEAAAVVAWGRSLPADACNVWQSRQVNRGGTAPYLMVVEKVREFCRCPVSSG